MQGGTDIQGMADRVTALLSEHPTHFLVDVRVKATNNFKIFLDADDGMPLSSLIEYNRKLYKQMEESGQYPDGNFSLEVSSPGVDEPLRNVRQYKKNVGRTAEVILADDTRYEGKLAAATDEGIVLEWVEGKGKKAVQRSETILFDHIKSTKIQVTF